MPLKKHIVVAIIFCLFSISSLWAQKPANVMEVDAKSLQLYNAAQWKLLYSYGKDAIEAGYDFPLLRMRMGYAAFNIGNYSNSLQQYLNVLQKDATNDVALYYCYINNIYLNRTNEARYFASKMSNEALTKNNIKKTKWAEVELEYSFKNPEFVARDYANYARVGVTAYIGLKTEIQNHVALYNQNIKEPKLVGVVDKNNISIHQQEYFLKINHGLSKNIALLTGFHYVKTPFNNLQYNNVFFMGGLQATTPYVKLKLIGYAGTITDSSFQQVELSLTTNPLGNSKLYTISRVCLAKNFVFSQIAGLQITKNIWLEGLITVGSYDKIIDREGLYLINDIDKKIFKAGGGLYFSLNKNITANTNYIFEQKQIYLAPDYFNQHSITGGLLWKL